MNKAAVVRAALGFTVREAGLVIAGKSGQNGYDTYRRWESTGKWDASTNVLLSTMLILSKNLNTSSTDRALDIVINTLKSEAEERG